MHNSAAKKLVVCLEERIKIPEPQNFVHLLEEVNICDRVYSVSLPNMEQVITEDGRYHLVSLRRVLNNNIIQSNKSGRIARAGIKFYWNWSSYNSDTLVNKIRANPEITDLMNQSKLLFSVLGKIRTYDIEDSERTFCITKPLLIIEGLDEKGVKTVLDWENRNTKYQEDYGMKRLYFSKQIKKEDYLAAKRYLTDSKKE